MRLFKKNKWKENQADKIKKQPYGKFSKILSISDVEIIKNDVYTNDIILKLSHGGILGTTIQIQNVSTMIIMCRKSVKISESNAKSFGLDIITYNDDRDVYYVAGTYNQFYCYLLWSYGNSAMDKLAMYISSIFNSNICSEIKMFTDYEKNILNFGDDITTIDIDYDRMEDMQKEMDPYDIAKHLLKPLEVDASDTNKATPMGFADYCMYGNDIILAFVKSNKIPLLNSLFVDGYFPYKYDKLSSMIDIYEQRKEYEENVAIEEVI